MPKSLLFLFSLILLSVPLMASDYQLKPSTILPGDIGVLRVNPDTGKNVRSISGQVDGVETHFYLRDNSYVGLISISAKKTPGTVQGAVLIQYQDGSEEKLVVPVVIGKKKFPSQKVRVSSGKSSLMSDALINKERDILYASFAESLPEPQWNGLFIKPINSRVSSDFGKKRTVNGRPWGQHGGIDLVGSTGTPIKAPAGGRVVLAQKLWIRGNTIVLDHGMGLFTMYNHLSRFKVKEGDLVQPGQILGNVGSTGLASGPHLHFEVRVNKISVNPWILLKKRLLID